MFEKTVEYSKLVNFPRYKKVYTHLLDRKFLLVDALSYYYSYKEIFEQNIYNFKPLSESPKIIDCGTNIGTSLIYFSKNFPESEILGFEADPEVFQVCLKNIQNFGLKNIKLMNEALWDSNTELEFMSEGADGGRLNSHVDTIKKIRVKTNVLSSFIQDRIDFLKMDIEGAELRVIKEIETKLNLVNQIFIEYHSFENETQSLDVILSILKNSGFRYQLKTQFASPNPFLKRDLQLGMDLQMNIFGYRV